MSTLNPMPKFLAYALSQAVKHPKQPITYLYCPECRVRLKPDEKGCPVCQKSAGNSPEVRQESPIPWWGLDEAGRALVYIPLGSLFGMSLPR